MASLSRRDAGSGGRDVLYAKAEQLLRGSPACPSQQGLDVLVSAAEAAVKVPAAKSILAANFYLNFLSLQSMAHTMCDALAHPSFQALVYVQRLCTQHAAGDDRCYLQILAGRSFLSCRQETCSALGTSWMPSLCMPRGELDFFTGFSNNATVQ